MCGPRPVERQIGRYLSGPQQGARSLGHGRLPLLRSFTAQQPAAGTRHQTWFTGVADGTTRGGPRPRGSCRVSTACLRLRLLRQCGAQDGGCAAGCCATITLPDVGVPAVALGRALPRGMAHQAWPSVALGLGAGPLVPSVVMRQVAGQGRS